LLFPGGLFLDSRVIVLLSVSFLFFQLEHRKILLKKLAEMQRHVSLLTVEHKHHTFNSLTTTPRPASASTIVTVSLISADAKAAAVASSAAAAAATAQNSGTYSSALATPQYLATVAAAKEMVAVAIQVIETDDELQPVKIIGFAANDNLVRAQLTAGASGMLAACKLLFF